MTYYIPLFFQFLRVRKTSSFPYHDSNAQNGQGDGPLEAGVRLLPFIIFMVVFSMLNGAFMPKLGYVTPWYVLGSALILIGSTLMCKASQLLELFKTLLIDDHTDTVNVETSTSNIYGYIILVGAGSGCYLVAGFAMVQSLVPITDIANAVGAMTICMTLPSLAPFPILFWVTQYDSQF